MAGSAIAAFEVDRISEDLRAHRATVRPAILAAGALGLAAVVASRWTGGAARRVAREAAQWLTLTLIALAGFVIAVLAGRRGAIALAAILTAINGTELYLHGQRIYRFGDPHHLFPPTPVVRWFASRPPPFRVVGTERRFSPAPTSSRESRRSGRTIPWNGMTTSASSTRPRVTRPRTTSSSCATGTRPYSTS